MSFYSAIARPVLFSLDAESAHNLTIALVSSPLGRLTGPGLVEHPKLQQQAFGLTFANPVGLGAGLDKQATALPAWQALGFGFAEIGTVTPRPQPGNPMPRLFRLPADGAIINRFGFNSEGAAAVGARLQQTRPLSMRIGVNIGKNKETPNERAADDYVAAVDRLHHRADYFVVNVSSPNTSGLRDLQEARTLRMLLTDVVARVRSVSSARAIPVLVKVSPDMSPDNLLAAVDASLEGGAAGVIATNTTLSRDGLRSPAVTTAETGGLSGAPLRERANAACRLLYRHTGGKVPIVGVGGIGSADAAYERIRSGASLVQIYTALIYEGPALVGRLLDGLAARLERDGFPTIHDAIGTHAR